MTKRNGWAVKANERELPDKGAGGYVHVVA
jgi:hypothetical protein